MKKYLDKISSFLKDLKELVYFLKTPAPKESEEELKEDISNIKETNLEGKEETK